MKRSLTPDDLNHLRLCGMEQLQPHGPRITVGCATCGCARGALNVLAAFKRHLRKSNIAAHLDPVGCSGWCSREPLVTIQIPNLPKLTFGEVTPQDVLGLVHGLVSGDLPLEKALYRTDVEENILEGTRIRYASNGRNPVARIPTAQRLPLFKHQKRIVLRNCGIINPLSLEQYCGRGGFSAAYTALTKLKQEKVIQEVIRSGLRGRGGAGFPTGMKWLMAHKAAGRQKYIICNADEGDPGAYMDRSVLEGDPFSVLEGMLIAGYAIGASEAILYVRREYPRALETVSKALQILKRWRLLGRDIFGSGFSFSVRIAEGAGAFVCGEETALIASLEGHQGEPVPRPPYPVEQGLHGMPTCINNVETLATIPIIIARGGRWFSQIGIHGNTGTKIFSLVGSVKNVGLIEVPLGTKMQDIVEKVGGGVPEGRTLKAVQTGGPSGGCIPAHHINVPLTYESLRALGSIMGSGGMIVLDDRTCMVDLSKFFMGFLKDESCGKCLPCREGTAAAHAILERITAGKGSLEDLERLKKICSALSATSLCGLGKTAANPVLSTLRYFRGEFKAHIQNRICPAGVCTALIRISIDPKTCIGCGACLKACPSGAISGTPKQAHRINRKKCISCKACAEVCSAGAISIS